MNNFDLKVTAVRLNKISLIVHLSDEREITLPLDQYPHLHDASDEACNNWRLVGRGQGIYWEAIDEDLSVAGFLRF